jgi:hypothetical protein
MRSRGWRWRGKKRLAWRSFGCLSWIKTEDPGYARARALSNSSESKATDGSRGRTRPTEGHVSSRFCMPRRHLPSEEGPLLPRPAVSGSRHHGPPDSPQEQAAELLPPPASDWVALKPPTTPAPPIAPSPPPPACPGAPAEAPPTAAPTEGWGDFFASPVSAEGEAVEREARTPPEDLPL